MSATMPSPGGRNTENYTQRGHTVTTVKETQRTTTTNKRGHQVVRTKTQTVYYVDNKPVRLNWFDRIRIKFMSTYEKQAFLADKLLKQERKAASGRK